MEYTLVRNSVELPQTGTVVGFDIETTGLDFDKDRLVWGIFACGNKIHLNDADHTNLFLKRLFDENFEIVGHNLMYFDIQFIGRNYYKEWHDSIPKYDWNALGIHDTMIYSRCLNREKTVRHSYEACVERFLERELSEKQGFEHRWAEHDTFEKLSETQIRYMVEDVIYLPFLLAKLKLLIINNDLQRAVLTEHKLAWAVNKMNKRGLPIIEQEIRNTKHRRQSEAAAIQNAHSPVNLNLNSYKQISDYWLAGSSRMHTLTLCEAAGIKPKQTKKGEPYLPTDETNRQLMIMHGINSERVEWIEQYKQAASPLKHLKWLEESIPFGKMLYTLWPLGTTTGRFAASKYAIQQMSRKLRHCFGYELSENLYMIKADWNMLELRLHAALNQDEDMAKAIYRGDDLHTELAKEAFNTDSPSGEQRQLGKTANFLLVFLGGVQTLVLRLIKQGLFVDLATGQRLYDAFHARYPTVKYVGERLLAEAHNLYPKPLRVEIYGGLYRDIPWIRDEDSGAMTFPLSAAMNARIQGAGGAVLKQAILNLPNSIVIDHLSAVVHDELVLSNMSKDEAELAAPFVENAMNDSLNEALRESIVNSSVETKIARTWG